MADRVTVDKHIIDLDSFLANNSRVFLHILIFLSTFFIFYLLCLQTQNHLYGEKNGFVDGWGILVL